MTTPNSINITKVKTTRGGYPVHIYQVFGDRIFGRFLNGGKWFSMHWRLDGWCRETQVVEDATDLIEEKTWRPFKDDEGPKRAIVRFNMFAYRGDIMVLIKKDDPTGALYISESRSTDLELSEDDLFGCSTWMREDGSETKFGIEE